MPPDQHVNPAGEPSSTPSPSRPKDPAADDTTFIPGGLREPTSRIRIGSQVTRIGRSPDNDTIVSDLGVSKQHAELRRTPAGRYSITDLGSHNGTYVNGTRVSQQELKEGDIIAIGHATFRLAGDELIEYIDDRLRGMAEWRNDGAVNDPIANLTDEDWSEIEHLNARIQSHAGPWGGRGGGQEISPGVRQMPFAEPDSLVWEFEQSWYRWHLVLTDFNWPAWSEGRQWYSAPDPARYDRLDQLTALKLLTAVIRSNRFSEGALTGAFESGDFPKIIDRFVRLRTAALPADPVPVQGDGSLVIRHRTGLGRVTVLPHHFSRALAARLGHEAVEAIGKGSYRDPDGQQVDWAGQVRAAVRAKESIQPELPLAVPEPGSSATAVEVTNESIAPHERCTEFGV